MGEAGEGEKAKKDVAESEPMSANKGIVDAPIDDQCHSWSKRDNSMAFLRIVSVARISVVAGQLRTFFTKVFEIDAVAAEAMRSGSSTWLFCATELWTGGFKFLRICRKTTAGACRIFGLPLK